MLLFFGGQLENWVEEIGSADLNYPREKKNYFPDYSYFDCPDVRLKASEHFQLFELNPF